MTTAHAARSAAGRSDAEATGGDQSRWTSTVRARARRAKCVSVSASVVGAVGCSDRSSNTARRGAASGDYDVHSSVRGHGSENKFLNFNENKPLYIMAEAGVGTCLGCRDRESTHLPRQDRTAAA